MKSIYLLVLLSIVSFGATSDISEKEIAISQKIVASYHNNEPTTDYIKALEKNHSKLKNQIKGEDNKNLVVFLGICIKELKDTISKPHTKENEALVEDLEKSISEGNHFLSTNTK